MSADFSAERKNRFVYDAQLLPLPVGNSNLTVFLIEPNGSWNEITRLFLLVWSPESKVQSLTTKENKVETQTEKQSEEQSKIDEKKELNNSALEVQRFKNRNANEICSIYSF